MSCRHNSDYFNPKVSSLVIYVYRLFCFSSFFLDSASNVVRKQDVSNAAVVRKPFADRAVNCHSPNLTTTKKPVCEDNDIAAETLSQCSDLDNDDFCSDIKVTVDFLWNSE